MISWVKGYRKVYGQRGIQDVWFQLTPESKSEFFKYLVDIKHPLSFEAGSPENLFEAYFTRRFSHRIFKKNHGPSVHRSNTLTKRQGLPPNRPRRLARSNPAEIYDEALRIEGRKGPGHVCDSECEASDHSYYHDFRGSTKARILGNADGSLTIISGRRNPKR